MKRVKDAFDERAAALDGLLSRYAVELRPPRPGAAERRESAAAERRLERLKELYLNDLLVPHG